MAETAMSAAGLLALFSTCIEIYGYVTSYKHFEADAQILLCHFEMQQAILLGWGTQSGVAVGKLLPHLDNDPMVRTITNTLEALVNLLKDTGRLQERYGFRMYDQDRPNGLIGPSPLPNDMSNVQSTINVLQVATRAFRKNTVWLNGAIARSKRVRWAIVDKSQFKQLLDDFTTLNNDLRALLSPTDVVAINQRIMTQSVLSSRGGRALAVLAKATYDSPYAGLHHRLRTEAVVAAPPSMNLTNIHSLLQIGNLESREYSESETRMLTFYTPLHGARVQILLEWVVYPVRVNAMYKEKLQLRTQHLVRCLMSSQDEREYRTLPCLGYFCESENSGHQLRIALAYTLPPLPSQDSAKAVSLLELISRTKSGSPPPDLDERFELARELAQTLQWFISTGWLHRAIRSENIQFFRSDGTLTSLLSLTNPYILGFESARPDSLDEFTIRTITKSRNHLYHHPEYLAKETRRFEKRYDVYSLGIVLLEIGLWTTAEGLATRKGTLDLREFHANLTRNYLPSLGPRCGKKYRKVVEYCLHGDFDRLEDGEAQPSFSMELFLEEVVQPLNTIVL